jgi:hypothetical protein
MLKYGLVKCAHFQTLVKWARKTVIVALITMVEYVSSKNLDKQAILIEREDDNDVVVLAILCRCHQSGI